MKNTTTTPPVKYKELIAQTEEQQLKESIDFVDDEAKLTLQTAILNAKRAIANATIELASAKRAVPFNVANIRIAQKRLLLAENDLESDELLLKELF